MTDEPRDKYLKLSAAPKPRRLPRRLFLRGAAGVGLALPLFDILLNDHGTAYADGESLPTRFGLWFFGNGTHLAHWTPSVGADWQPPPDGSLTPLLPLKEYVSVVSGLNVKTSRHPHHSGMANACSGGPHLKLGDVRDTIVSTFKYPSVDQIAADYFMGQEKTKYRSLEVAVTRFRGTDEGTTFQHLSHNGSVGGETNVNPSEESPRAFWDRLFNQGTAGPLVLKARASVLDSVGSQIQSLQGKLGHRDRQRLDQHLTSVRELEQRLGAPTNCVKPADPGELPDLDGKEQIAEKNAAMSQLMALALACGLTRAFSVQYSTCGSGVVYWNVGATNGQHYMNHTEGAPRPKQAAALKFTMEQLAVFLSTLQSTPEGNGNLLDQCSIVVTTEHSEGWSHSQDDMQYLICGKGGGRLRGNVHYRDNGSTPARALLTGLRGAGLPLTEFGYEQAHTASPIGELEV